MYIEIDIKVGGNTYKIEKLQKFFGYWEFRRLISPALESGLNQDIWEYMGSCVSANITGELSKLLGEFAGSENTTSEIYTLAGGKKTRVAISDLEGAVK